MAFPTNPFEGCTGLFICYARWLNTITDGAFWSMFLLAFAVMLFLATFRFGTARSLGYSTLGAFFLSFYLLYAGLIQWWFASIFIVAMVVSMVFMRISEK